jgi:hypothetical protein
MKNKLVTLALATLVTSGYTPAFAEAGGALSAEQAHELFQNLGGSKGPQPGTYVVTGPDFQGAVPGEMIRIPTRTKIGVLAVRIFVKRGC